MKFLLIFLLFPSTLYAQMGDVAASVRASQLWGPIQAIGTERNATAANWTRWVGIESKGCRQDFTHLGTGFNTWNAAYTDATAHPPKIDGPFSGSASLTVTSIDRRGIHSPIFYVDGVLRGTVDITPLNLVKDTLNLTASASDNVGVVGVQFYVDGAAYQAELTDATRPYSVYWDTHTVPNGPHRLTAKARDAAGNTATAMDLLMTVDNSGGLTPLVANRVATLTLTLSELSIGLHAICVRWTSREGRDESTDPVLFKVDQINGATGGIMMLDIPAVLELTPLPIGGQ